MKIQIIFFLGILFWGTSCASYFERSVDFQREFVKGDFENADKELDKQKRAVKGKNRFLYFCQKGVVLQMKGAYAESNNFFEEAYIFGEDYRKNYGKQLAGFMLNPEVETYKGEDFELVLVHYYKALNFLFLKQYDSRFAEIKMRKNQFV